jgi:hypothetical protein
VPTNSENAIKRGPSPQEAVPKRLFHALEEFILIDDWDKASDRVIALELLLRQSYGPLGRDRDIARWVDKNRGRDFILGQTDDGTLFHRRNVNPRRPAAIVPRRLVDQLIRDILTQPTETRDLREGATSWLVSEWDQLVLDNEKLSGHLLRVHQIDPHLLTGDIDRLVVRHSQIHAKARQASSSGGRSRRGRSREAREGRSRRDR